ncbi:MAG: fatty acid--CoA ligase family protein [Actinomycetota bacterium]|nr:fatty acid--CoA ligase family protein [Actinomycetota bacterium]
MADPQTIDAVLANVVAAAAQRFGDRRAFVDPDGTSTTYTDLHVRSDEVAAGMVRAGVRERSVVALTSRSDTAYLLAYVAAAKLGAAVAGVNPRLTSGEQQRCLEVAHPDLVIASGDDVHRLAVRGGRPDELQAAADRPVSIVFTSGTTGQPKGAWFTDHQLAAITRIDVDDRWGDPNAPESPMMAGTQFAHVGFMTKLPWYLRLGTTTHLLAAWRAADALDLIERERIPSVGGVAPQVALMLRDPSFDQRDLSHVRTIVMGGGPSSPALVDEARRRFDASYSIRYSSTESGGVGTATAFDADDDEALYTVGRSRPGIDVEVRDDSGVPIDSAIRSGETGEVWVRSPATMTGYWRDPEATAATLEHGWLRTGDLGRIDTSGCLVLAGRRNEMFIRGGYNVYPLEVEAVLTNHPGVSAVAVIPRLDDVMGEIGVAVVVPPGPRDGPDVPTLAELRAFAAQSLATHKLPEALVLVDRLPLTAMQKLDRRRTAELVADDALSAAEQARE